MHIKHVSLVDDELVVAFEHLVPQLTSNGVPPSRELLERMVASDATALFVARWPDANGSIVGSGTLNIVYAPSGVHARIEDVIVDASVRGHGIGEAITLALLEHAQNCGVKYVALTSNPKRLAANKLYQKIGFKHWETNVYRFDCNHG